MDRCPTWTTSSRSTLATASPDEAWSIVAGAGPGAHWYLDAAPFVVRGVLDRLVGGAGRRWPAPDRPLLEPGDTAGFWQVEEADVDLGLVLRADVRAPGTVRLHTRVRQEDAGCRLEQTVTLDPRGLLGLGYLLADLPAREVVIELTQRRLLADLATIR
ncbi:DUF2867 domain-containing protein [Nocardioides acrostichi]|uniref:DUF2867 domain-containing protein n=1 Tax=Nocardioides acrostichi TaxID=2784339 RepID=A0A930UUY7_9ACTN|nr:DUF2867 domain-containing protein [Nocardioides acrostichi]MBF4161323.1 DUF2867 domain-containing protein [Nocardioides acrostichi]